MKENVCIDCQYYERCGKPERKMKCLGYEENGHKKDEITVDEDIGGQG